MSVPIEIAVADVAARIAQRLGADATPFVISETLAANIGGAATLIGDPAQHHHRQPFQKGLVDFLVNAGLPSL